MVHAATSPPNCTIQSVKRNLEDQEDYEGEFSDAEEDCEVPAAQEPDAARLGLNRGRGP